MEQVGRYRHKLTISSSHSKCVLQTLSLLISLALSSSSSLLFQSFSFSSRTLVKLMLLTFFTNFTEFPSSELPASGVD